MTLAFVVLLFAGATMYSQRLLTTDVDALDIASNAAPSITELADARAELTAIAGAAADLLAARDDTGRAVARASLLVARRRFDDALARYAALPMYAGEHELYRAVLTAVRRVADDLADPARADRTRLRVDLAAVDAALRDVSQLNREQLNASAVAIAHGARRRNLYALVLGGIAVVIASLATILAARTVEEHVAMLDRRAKELESLAIQVGHEIANPLLPIQVALRFAADSTQENLRTAAERGARGLSRIRESIDRLLHFAQASLPAAACAPTALAPALEGTARAAGLQLAVDPALRVRCSEERLRDILHGLLAGCVAPAGVAPDAVEVCSSSRRVRIAVTTPADVGASADPFDPQLRDPQSGHPGLDLRLATVRRQVEACGGRVGVRHKRRRRCVWIELPRA